MTDCKLILNYLLDGKWHDGYAMSRELKPGAVSWAYRARISDLRKKLYTINSRIGESGGAEYQLDINNLPKEEPEPEYKYEGNQGLFI